MNVAQALAAGRELGLDRLDAQLLLLQALGRSLRDRAWLLAHDEDELAPGIAGRFAELAARRGAGEPLAYIVGHKEFHGLDLQVDGRVLVPRPDTETLVDWALELLAGHDAPRVVDLGTGSGAIALALRKALPAAHVHAVDASAGALEVATGNARRLGLEVSFSLGCWLDGLPAGFDLIVSNPPYVPAGDPHLAALQHEPTAALVAGSDGLSDLRTIIRDAPAHLAEGGWLLLEHGYDQAAAVRALLQQAGFGFVATRRDLAGQERCSGGKWLERG